MSAYDDLVAADGAIAHWALQTLAPPSAPPNFDCIDIIGANNGTLQPNSVAGLTQGLAGPILTTSPDYGMGGGVARIPQLGNNAPPIFLTGAQTWECWFQDAGTGDVHMLMNRGGDVTNTYLSVNQPRNGALSSRVVASLDWSGTLRGLVSCAVTPNAWHMAHLTYDGVDTAILYVDSWEVDRDETCPAAPLTDTNPWRMGYIANPVFGAVDWSHALSHIAIYPSVLTPEQIIAHNVAALGSRADNPCGDTLAIGCPLTTGEVGVAYSSTVDVFNGTPPYTFAVFSGALPDGLSLNTVTGEVSGTPTLEGTFNFVIEVTDATMNTALSPGCVIVIGETPPPIPPVGTGTFAFDVGEGGLGSTWYLIPQLSDEGIELRDKVVKSVRVTGKVSNANIKVYGFGPLADVDIASMEAGTSSITGPIDLPDTTRVQQSQRFQVNCGNLMTSTVRVEGRWDASDGSDPDQIHEIAIESAQQGIRR